MAVAGVLLIIWFVFILSICLIAVAFNIFCTWVFFNKCGEKGWKSLIPFYNTWTLVQIADLNWWWVLPLWISPVLYLIASFFNGFAQGIYEYSSSAGVVFYLIALLVYLVTILVGLLGIFSSVNTYYNISKKFNKSGWFTLLFYFFANIMYLVAGFSKDFVYDKSIETSKNGIIK